MQLHSLVSQKSQKFSHLSSAVFRLLRQRGFLVTHRTARREEPNLPEAPGAGRPSDSSPSLLKRCKTLQLTLICFPEVGASWSRISHFPRRRVVRLPLGRQEFTTTLQLRSRTSSICQPSHSANSLERRSCASRGVDAADGHVLGVTVKQASNDTPPQPQQRGARVASANPGNASVGHMVIGTVPCNLGGEAAKFGRQLLHLSPSGCWSTARRCLKHTKRRRAGRGVVGGWR